MFIAYDYYSTTKEALSYEKNPRLQAKRRQSKKRLKENHNISAETQNVKKQNKAHLIAFGISLCIFSVESIINKRINPEVAKIIVPILTIPISKMYIDKLSTSIENKEEKQVTKINMMIIQIAITINAFFLILLNRELDEIVDAIERQVELFGAIVIHRSVAYSFFTLIFTRMVIMLIAPVTQGVNWLFKCSEIKIIVLILGLFVLLFVIMSML